MVLPTEEWKLKTLKIFQRIGYSSVIGIILLIFRKEQIALLFNFETENYLLNACSTFLLFVVIVLLFQWIIASSHEFALLQGCARHALFVKRQSYFVIIGLTILLGVLGYYAKNILVFSFIFTIYSFVNIVAEKLVISHVISAFKKHTEEQKLLNSYNEEQIDSASLRTAKDYYEGKEWEIFKKIKEYYSSRRLVLRSIIVAFFSCISLILALIAYLTQRCNLSIIAYIIIILDILVGEIIIFLWRKDRDKKIENYI